ncbi:MAG: hypothetical protein SFV32_02280 [Opitutaceae bacterium]|nr:hypothetical protein [Opitutaceae bacterium]
MSWLHRLARAIEPFTIPHLIRYLVIGQGVLLAGGIFGLLDVGRLALLPAAVLAGEWWRVVTFVFVPPPVLSEWGLLFAALGLYLIYLYGTALEQIWGTARLNLFVGIGYLLTLGVAFLTPNLVASNLFISISLFLAFAYLNPDIELLVFFILPVKIKWIAAVTWAMQLAIFIRGDWGDRLAVLASVGNFLLFFSGDIFRRLRGTTASLTPRPNVNEGTPSSKQYRHQCRVCKRTDASNPELDFRYCSKCAGDSCYCSDHLRDHVHVVDPKSE